MAIYTAGVDPRVAACVSSGGWGDGAKKFRKQHASPEAWTRFTDMMERGKRERERTGKSIMVSRYDIVPIPPGLRGNLSQNSIMEFPFEVVETTTRSPPTTWWARSRRVRCCCSIPPTTR